MEEKDIYKKLTEIFNDIFMREDIILTSDTSADDIEGWDSHKHIEIIITVQEFFNLKLSTKELDNLNTIKDLVNAISSILHERSRLPNI